MKQTPVLTRLLILFVLVLVMSSCIHDKFPPVNVGREYGNPTMPWLVSHVPERNRWVVTRTKHHNFFQLVLCHNPVCRVKIGRRKALNAISFEEYRRRIRKNAKKGLYKTTPVTPSKTKPANKKAKPDSVIIPIIPKDTARMAAPAITQAPGAPAREEQILKADSLITLNEFLFEVNSARLKPEHYSELDLLSAYLVLHPTLEVSISGHTDNTGSERHNVVLSTHRAEAVADYLVSKGVTDEKVIYEGFGSSQPIADNKTAQGRGKNRRVEILIRNPKKE
jgi:outer membrane protein OmpA-like peptidoglycan-associated protein